MKKTFYLTIEAFKRLCWNAPNKEMARKCRNFYLKMEKAFKQYLLDSMEEKKRLDSLIPKFLEEKKQLDSLVPKFLTMMENTGKILDTIVDKVDALENRPTNEKIMTALEKTNQEIIDQQVSIDGVNSSVIAAMKKMGEVKKENESLKRRLEAVENRQELQGNVQRHRGIQNLTLIGWLGRHRTISFTGPEVEVAETIAREKFSEKHGEAPKVRNHKALFYNKGEDDDILRESIREAKNHATPSPTDTTDTTDTTDANATTTPIRKNLFEWYFK